MHSNCLIFNIFHQKSLKKLGLGTNSTHHWNVKTITKTEERKRFLCYSSIKSALQSIWHVLVHVKSDNNAQNSVKSQRNCRIQPIWDKWHLLRVCDVISCRWRFHDQKFLDKKNYVEASAIFRQNVIYWMLRMESW